MARRCCCGPCKSTIVLDKEIDFVAMDETTTLSFDGTTNRFVFDGKIKPRRKIGTEAYILRWQNVEGSFDIVCGKETDTGAARITIDANGASIATSTDTAPLPPDAIRDFELYVTPSHIYISAVGSETDLDVNQTNVTFDAWNLAEGSSPIAVEGDWYIESNAPSEISAVTISDAKFVPGDGYYTPGTYCDLPRCAPSVGGPNYSMYGRMGLAGYPGRLFYDATWDGSAPDALYGNGGELLFAGCDLLTHTECGTSTAQRTGGSTLQLVMLYDDNTCGCESSNFRSIRTTVEDFEYSSGFVDDLHLGWRVDGFVKQNLIRYAGSPGEYWRCKWIFGLEVIADHNNRGTGVCPMVHHREVAGDVSVELSPSGIRSGLTLSVTGSHSLIEDVPPNETGCNALEHDLYRGSQIVHAPSAGATWNY